MLDTLNSSESLVKSIKTRKWSSIPKYLHEANLFDVDNTYALHEVCCDPEAPLKVVQDIYYAYPEAAFVKNYQQDTPISIAVSAVFEDAVRFLANACPKSSLIGDVDGCTPINSAISVLNRNNMIEYIIKTNPEAAFILDAEKESAFDYFFGHWNVFLRIILHVNQKISDEILDDLIGYGDWMIGDIYLNTCLFLKAVNIYRRDKMLDDNHLLHCALSEESCHLAFCKLLMKLHPEQILTKDSNGDLPIHIIAACRDLSDEESFLCFDCFTKKNKLLNVEFADGSSKYCCEECLESESEASISRSFELRPVQKVHGLVEEMITVAPQTVLIPDSRGNHPLHIAIHNQHSYDVVCQLYRAFPDTVKIRDENTKLLPFMLAAVGNWESKESQISIIYLLLNEDPLLIFGV